MSILNDDFMNKVSGVFAERPAVPDDKMPPLLSTTQGQCEFCKKFVPLVTMPVSNTGIVQAQEPLCKECAPTFKDQARIVCVPCKQVVLWVDPHVEKTGFEFKKGAFYHVDSCPTCKPGITQTKVLEKVVYFKERNIPYT